MDSDRYIMQDDRWRKLLLEQVRDEELLKNTRSHCIARTFRQALQELLEAVFGSGFDLRRFVESNTFRDMGRDVWQSYYSNVVLYARPID